MKIPEELLQFAPFFHDISLGEGLNTAPEIYRIRFAENFFFPPLTRLFGGDLRELRVLDIGCNCGGFAFLAHKLGATVIGVDSNKRNIGQANAIKKYLGLSDNEVSFKLSPVEKIDSLNLGQFDVTIFAGVLYHLTDPINVLTKVSRMTRSVIVVDSHVHYSSPKEEDIPSWWMLSDMDRNDREGLFKEDDILSLKKYSEFENNHRGVDYGLLENKFMPSPQTARDIDFINNYFPHPTKETIGKYAIGSNSQGDLSLIPNKKALFKLLRHCGFEDLPELVPHRFSPTPYILKIRVGLIAIKRVPGKGFATSEVNAAKG